MSSRPNRDPRDIQPILPAAMAAAWTCAAAHHESVGEHDEAAQCRLRAQLAAHAA